MPTPRKDPDAGVLARLYGGDYVLRDDPHCVLLEDHTGGKVRYSYPSTVARALETVAERVLKRKLAEEPAESAEGILDVAGRVRDALKWPEEDGRP